MDTRWEDYERSLLNEFIDNHSLNFKGRRQVLVAIKNFTLARDYKNDKKALCLTGEAGSGKSAVFAQTYTSLKKKNVLLLINSAGTGPRSHDIHFILERWIEELCRFLNFKNDVSETNNPGELYRYFHSLLYEAGRKKRTVVLMDAPDQLESTGRGLNMNWLPDRWPQNTRFICTSVPCEQIRILLQKTYTTELSLPHLTPGESRNIAISIYKKSPHKLDPIVLQTILDRRRNDGIRAAVNPLWLTMAIEELNTSGPAVMPMSEKCSLPATTEALFLIICRHAEMLYGDLYTRTVLSLLALGHNGWKEKDLESMVPRVTREPWSKLTFMAFKHHFRACLCEGRHSAQYRFSQSQMYNVIAGRYLQQKKMESKLHHLAAGCLLQLPADNPMRCDIMFHLLGASLSKGMADYYGAAMSKPEFNAATHALAEFIGNIHHQKVRERIQRVRDMLTHEHPRLNRLIEHLQFDLAENLESLLPFREKEHYHFVLFDFIEELFYLYPHNIEWLRGLAIACERLGNIYVSLRLHNKAKKAYEASIDLIELLENRVEDNTEWLKDLSVPLEKLGDIYLVQGNPVKALEIYRILSGKVQKMTELKPDNSLWHEVLFASFIKAGDCCLAMYFESDAHNNYKNALKVAERMAVKYPYSKLWAMNFSVSYDKHGDMCSSQGSPKAALEAYETSLGIIKPFAMKAPANTAMLKDLSLAYDKLGKVYAMQGFHKKAKQAYKASGKIKDKLADMGDIGTIK